jgi:mRNA-degrading endonuclease RelE of RelBE toxin-antitoxin system
LIPRRVDLTHAAKRDLRNLTQDDRRAIFAGIDAYAEDRNTDVKKLSSGRFRVIFALEPGRMIVESIVNRRDAYR